MLDLNWEAVKGIVKRDLTKYFRNKQQIISSLIMPAIFMIFLRSGFANLGGGEPVGYNLGAYMGSGIIVMVICMSGVMLSGFPILFDKMLGFQDIYAVAPVKRRNLVIGFLIGGALKCCFMSSVVVLIGVFSWFIDPELAVLPNNWGLGIAGALLSIIPIAVTIFFGSMIFACIGLCIAARTDMTNAFLWNNLLVMPLVFISGALIPVESFGSAKIIPLFNPTTYFADAIRVWLGGVTGDAGTDKLFFNGNILLGYAFDIAILAAFGVLMFYLAFRIFGGSLQESSGGFAGVIHKKVAKAREKLFKNLDPADQEIMIKVSNKIDFLKMGQIMGLAGEGKQAQAVKMLKDAGINDEDIKAFFAAGMRMMMKMTKTKRK